MKRLTGKLVREARRRIARGAHVPTSRVQIFRGHEEKRGADRYCWRHTWRVVIGGSSEGTHHAWANIRDFLEGVLL